MGMSIDEIIQGIQIIKAQAEWDYPLDWQIVLDGATETMRKYQKVQEIMAKRPKDMISSNPTLRAINEVVEDGTN